MPTGACNQGVRNLLHFVLQQGDCYELRINYVDEWTMKAIEGFEIEPIPLQLHFENIFMGTNVW